MHEALGWNPSTAQTQDDVYDCNPSTRRKRQKNQEFKVILSYHYKTSLRLCWITQDPASGRQAGRQADGQTDTHTQDTVHPQGHLGRLSPQEVSNVSRQSQLWLSLA